MNSQRFWAGMIEYEFQFDKLQVISMPSSMLWLYAHIHCFINRKKSDFSQDEVAFFHLTECHIFFKAAPIYIFTNNRSSDFAVI